MKPAFSVIFFTVSSGGGLGLMIWLILGRWLSGGVDGPPFWAGVGLAAALISGGLLSSTLHLANPRNAWRAFSRFRTSWLSREGVLSVLIYPLAGLYLLALLRGDATLEWVTGGLLLLLAVAVLFCTAMIYACLKTIPRWRNPYTKIAYPLFGLASGGLLWLALRAWAVSGASAAASGLDPWVIAALLLLAAGAALKLLYWNGFADSGEAGLSNTQALNLKGNVRLLDVGHTHANFLTDEFGFVLARERARLLRSAAIVLAFVLPLLLLLWRPQAAPVAALLCLIGLLVERWLFFAEAQHVVRLYHGQRRI
ncbi:MAG: dimethyl sulfoxide reductase anchor subunit family protein [Burkholderiaceae bacterium]